MTTPLVNRTIVVVLDGLRPDAIAAFGLRNMAQLCGTGAHTLSAQTVEPSVTACVMTSLCSGATPRRHGIQTDRFSVPRSRGSIHPIPRVLAQHGLPSSIHVSRIPFLMRPMARQIARFGGFDETRCHGEGCYEILAGARETIQRQRTGFILLHWPDIDRAGHEYGWMSPEYGDAARRADDALGKLIALVDLPSNPGTVLVALADHGGGGENPKRHDSASPIDRTIPIAIAGSAVIPGPIAGPVSLLDIPATVLWALGVPRPATYVGRPLTAVFTRMRAAA